MQEEFDRNINAMKQTHADELAKKEYMIKSLQNDLQKAKENDNKSKDKLEAEIKKLSAKTDEITKKNEELLKQNEELTKKREKETLQKSVASETNHQEGNVKLVPFKGMKSSASS